MKSIRNALINGTLIATLAAIGLSDGRLAFAQTNPGIPPSITTPDKVETRLGPLDFKDGAPSAATVEKIYDNLLRAVADSLRQEVNADGIRVLSVYPGRTATPMQAGVHAIEGKDYQPDHLMQPEEVAAIVVSALTLPRSAEVTDIHVRPLRKPC